MNEENESTEESQVPEEPLSPPPPAAKNKTALLVVLAVVVIVVGYFGFNWIQFRMSHVITDDARVKGTLVTISSRVPGYIIKITVKEGYQTKEKDLLVKLDPTEIQEKVEIAKADLSTVRSEWAKTKLGFELQRKLVKAGLDQARATVEVAQSRVKQAQEDLKLEIRSRAEQIKRAKASLKASRAVYDESTAKVQMAKAEYIRHKELFEKGVIPKQRMEEKDEDLTVEKARRLSNKEKVEVADANLSLNEALKAIISVKKEAIKTARGELKRALAGLDSAEASKTSVAVSKENINMLESKVEKAKAHLRDMEKLLSDTEIFSPMNAVVSKTIADTGERVQPGQPLLILNDIRDIWVTANIEETYIRKVKLNQLVDVEVDAFPGRVFKGRVINLGAAAASEFSLLPNDNSNRNFTKVTQRIPVKIAVDDPQAELKPGMMVVVKIAVSGL